ncbi:organic cation transporter protein-like [Danaus plexippus]|uniref:organic cation transporter protein-like n=1 Tax=Danaus plexippus TaxID=13037 RepID=UPI002AB209C6|nr:organic cation transporter protein-like [Danaus plexippus]
MTAVNDSEMDINRSQSFISTSDVLSRKSELKDEESCNSPEDALEKAVLQLGPFGIYQRYVLFLLFIPNMLSAMYSLNYVFVADQVAFRCLVKECEGQGGYFANKTIQDLLPTPNETCHRYQAVQADQISCDIKDYYLNKTIKCNDFVYETMNSIYAEFSMACKEWQRTLVGTIRNSALPLALVLTGYISDRYGRRTAFCIFAACAGVLGIIKSFMPNYSAYLTMEFLEAALGYGFNSAVYVMIVELARPSLRVAFACVTGIGYGLGGMLFALIASQVPYWRNLLRAIHTPALFLPLYWFLLDESARWLHATNKKDRSIKVIKKAARWNKVIVDEDLINSIKGETGADEVKNKNNPWLNLLKSKILMLRFCICCWCWISVTFVYYGLTINSVSMSGDKYVNFALSMFMEIVASLLIMMALERFGRKQSIFVAFLVCGITCVTPFFISHSNTKTALFFVGKLSITFAFNSLYVFTAELFPTEVRSSAMAAVSLIGRVGSLVAPQTPLLSEFIQALLYGISSISAALLVLLAPETRRAALPQHVQHAEQMHALAHPPNRSLGIRGSFNDPSRYSLPTTSQL